MAWISVYCGSGTAAIHKPQTNASGVYREKFSVSIRLTAALVLRRGAALSGRAFSSWAALKRGGFRRRAIALLCFRFLFRYTTTGAEAEVRVRARGRIGRVQRQRG